MSEWAQKRFWDTAEVTPLGDGFGITLDGRPVKTPAKAPLMVPTRSLALEIAQEWQDQDEVVQPLSMPFTRSANAAIDKVTHQREEVARLIAAYGESDLLCYRAPGPKELVQRQSDQWDPLLDWAYDRFDARLAVGEGVMHVRQDPGSTERLSKPVFDLTAFELTAFHDLVSLSGSLVIGLAVIEAHQKGDEIWQISRLDELWQEEQWGEDEEAAEQAEFKRTAFLHAERFYFLLQN
jgi:chaperone required for assembly of F1-ATPase